jgi:hypothetical protein
VAESQPRPALHRISERLGFIRESGCRTIWAYGSSREHFQRARPVLGELRRRHPRLGLVALSPDAATRAWLAENDRDAIVLPPPWQAGFAVRRFLRRLNPRLVVLLESPRGFGARSLRGAVRRRVPVVLFGAAQDLEAGELAHVERLFVPPAAVEALRRRGVDSARMATIANGAGPLGVEAARQMAQDLEPLLRRDLKALRHARAGGRQGWRGAALGILQSRLGAPLLRRRVEILPDLASLAAALGHPRTILCLGNGPSSEDARLDRLEYDCLFRVNWMWKKRGRFLDPHMVFTGDQQTVRMVRTAIFGFQSIDTETRTTLRAVFDPRLPRLRCFTLERVPSFLHEVEWAAKPTNGAAMLATAVALEPARLILAGIDLFDHPQGSYPGDPSSANAYTPRHDREVELQIIEKALQEYRGEVVLMSDVLRRHLEARGRDSEDGKVQVRT